jgi:hypothetical protein
VRLGRVDGRDSGRPHPSSLGEAGDVLDVPGGPGAARPARREALATRGTSLTSALSALTSDEVDHLAAALDTMLTTVTLARAEERSAHSDGRPGPWLCRLCDFAACGRSEGDCPVDNAVTTGNQS